MMKTINFQELDDELYSNGVTENVTMEVIPLCPISNSDKINSKVVLSSTKISPNKVFGILENISGIHIDAVIRKEIKERNKKLKKKELGDRPKVFEKNVTPDHKGNVYFPVLDDFIEIVSIDDSNIMVESSFLDSTSYLLRRGDEGHAKGVIHVDHRIDLEQAFDGAYFKDNIDMYPMFYNGIFKREYLILNGSYKIHLKATPLVKKLLVEANKENRVAFLGNSESIIKVVIS